MANSGGQPKDLVSIIIPIRRGENIYALLRSIKRSTYTYIEIIVVDEEKERSIQRNIGMHRARGKYYLILDSDQHVSPGLIDECVGLSQYFNGIYIPEKIMTNGLFGYIRNWERQFYNGTPVDCVRFVHADGCPMFDKEMSGPEDADWDRKFKGYKIVSENCIYHYENVTPISYLRKKAYYSKSMDRFAKLNPGDKVLNFWWRYFGVYLEGGKWKRFFSRPDLAVALMGINFIRGIIYLCRK